MSESRLAFDIGGANIKVATADGYTASNAFPLWKQPDGLANELSTLIESAPASDSIVATMTGELADCFATKREGVEAIVDALLTVADGRSVSIYLLDGTFASPDEARQRHHLAAASNWHGLAKFATRFNGGGNALLVDIGSTTCDVIPIVGDQVVARGFTDTERLLASELIYMGAERTPVCAVASTVPYRDQECPVARELFATTLDLHLLTGEIAERPHDLETSDGRPATSRHALVRLGRCVCADQSEFGPQDGLALAEFVSFELSELLRDAMESVRRHHQFHDDTLVVLSGQGDFLIQRFLPETVQLVSLSELIGPDLARCAPAYAISVLAEELDTWSGSGGMPFSDGREGS
jgi:probable H4MPT-linked C1 transfer pathway protein